MSESAARPYVYELRENGAIVATGRLTLEQQPAVGESLRLGQLSVRVRELVPGSAGEHRLILDAID